MGSDREGLPSDGWRHPPQPAGAVLLQLQLHPLLRQDLRSQGRGHQASFHQPGHPLSVRQDDGLGNRQSPGRKCVAGPGIDPRHCRPAAHSHALLHSAQRKGSAQLGGLGDGADRFYVMTTFLGFGAAALIGKANICAKVVTGFKCAPGLKPNNNMSMPRLADFLGTYFFGTTGGEFLLAFIAAVAFATILAVVAGLTLAASGAFSHDFYVNVIRTHILHGHVSEREQVLVARITAALVGLLSIWLAAKVGATANVAALVAGVAFVIAASANLPAILFTLYWKRFNTWGAVASLVGDRKSTRLNSSHEWISYAV